MAEIEVFGKTVPDYNNTNALLQEATMARINCHNIGKITEFDKDTQTCTVQLMQLKQFRDNTYTPAPLTQVPLIIYGQGSAHITLPDPVGSICLVLFLDRNIDSFIQTGELYTPDTSRMHDFTDCVALTTFKTAVNPIGDYDPTAITIAYKKLIDEVLYHAVIKNFGNSLQLKVYNEENTSQFNVADKFNMQNSSQSLATLIQNLITTIKDLTVNLTTGAVTTTSQDALDIVADDFSELLN